MKLQQLIPGPEYLAQVLKAYGVSHVFYVEAIVRESMREMEAVGIKRVVAHSEKAAAYMADGYARAGKKPGVCMCQSVGAANLAAGLQDAWLSSSPVVAVTGRKAPEFQHRHSYQELWHDPLFAPVTKYNVYASQPDLAPLYLRQCFREATTGRPGPVHLDVTNHAGAHFDRAKLACAPEAEQRFTRIPAFRPAPDPADVEAVAAALASATRPVLVVGNGAAISGAHEEVRRMADLFGLPVVSSVDGKGLLPDTHPLYLGPVGDYNRKCANDLTREADFALYAGCGVNDQLTLDWTIPAPGTAVAQIDILPEELGRNLPNVASILGDAKLSLAALIEALQRRGFAVPTAWTEKAKTLGAAWWKAYGEIAAGGAVPILPERLCRDLSDALPENSVVVADTGFGAVWMGAYLRLSKPGQRLLRPGGGSLGWSFPASLGVKCALPDHPVFCFTGDGGFWYHLCEMETAARHNIKTITVLNNNGGFAQCRGKILSVYDGHDGCPEDQFLFRSTNFCAIAEAMGCLALRVERPDDIAPALAEALRADRPVLVEVLTDITRDPLHQNW